MRYVVNKNPQSNGDHEVHTERCTYCPDPSNALDLGDHATCHSAVRAAKQYYSQANGCFYCSRPCHTG